MTSHAIEKINLLIELVDDAVYNDLGYGYISGLLDDLKDAITENFAPGIVVPEGSKVSWVNREKPLSTNPVWSYWADEHGNIRRQYLDSDTKISAPVDAPWTKKKEL